MLATTDAANAEAQKELSSILALGEPETAPAAKAEEKPAAPAAKPAAQPKPRKTTRTAKKSKTSKRRNEP